METEREVKLKSPGTNNRSSVLETSISVREFFEDLHSHNMYFSSYIVTELRKCGFSAAVMIKKNGIVVEGIRIDQVVPEWGEPGISSLSILAAVYELLTKERPKSEMIGRGFWYRDVLSKLKAHLGIEMKKSG